MCAKLPTSNGVCLPFFPPSLPLCVQESCGATVRWVMKSAERELGMGPLRLMFCLVLTCTRHLNSHWFGWKNIWNRAHQSKDTHTGAVKILVWSVCYIAQRNWYYKGATLMIHFILFFYAWDQWRVLSTCGAPGQPWTTLDPSLLHYMTTPTHHSLFCPHINLIIMFVFIMMLYWSTVISFIHRQYICENIF